MTSPSRPEVGRAEPCQSAGVPASPTPLPPRPAPRPIRPRTGSGARDLQSGDGISRCVFESEIVGVYVADLEGNITDANDAFLQLLGYRRADLPLYGNAMTPPEWQPLDERALEAARSGGVAPPWEKEYVAKDGRRVPSLVAITLLPDGDANQHVGIVTDLGDRKRAERQILEQRRELRSLAISLARAEEAERRRIATGLHDDIGQTLAAAKLRLGRLAISGQSERVVDELGEVAGLLDEALGATRSLTFELAPPVLYELGLEAGLESLGEKLERETGIAFELVSDKSAKAISGELRVVLYRIVRELLHNIEKHAQASSATVSLHRDGDSIRVTVADDGVGFDTREAGRRPSAGRGYGLFNIAEQIEHLGGSLDFEFRSEGGTQVVVVTPLGPVGQGAL